MQPSHKMAPPNQISTVAKEVPRANENSQKQSSTGWGQIGIIVATLGIAAALAVGHDRYNNYMHGKHVNEIALSQAWVVRFGTAFAFLFKTFLAAGMVASYTQRLWRNLKVHAFELQAVDSLMAAPTDALSFLNLRAWVSVPGLFLMGLVLWCVIGFSPLFTLHLFALPSPRCLPGPYLQGRSSRLSHHAGHPHGGAQPCRLCP